MKARIRATLGAASSTNSAHSRRVRRESRERRAAGEAWGEEAVDCGPWDVLGTRRT